MARGETMEYVIIALFFVTCFGYLTFVEIRSWIKNGHSALFQGELMNIKVGDRVLYKCLAATSIGIVQKILGDSYYIINGLVVYSFEILKKV